MAQNTSAETSRQKHTQALLKPELFQLYREVTVSQQPKAEQWQCVSGPTLSQVERSTLSSLPAPSTWPQPWQNRTSCREVRCSSPDSRQHVAGPYAQQHTHPTMQNSRSYAHRKHICPKQENNQVSHIPPLCKEMCTQECHVLSALHHTHNTLVCSAHT